MKPQTTPTNAAASARFGIPADTDLTSHPHIRVRIDGDQVTITEMRENIRSLTALDRCVLTRAQWDAIAGLVAPTFNADHRREFLMSGSKAGRFPKSGDAALDVNNLGRELLVLAWAVETLDPAQDAQLFDRAGNSWLRFDPVERWWLHNQTVAVSGGLEHRVRVTLTSPNGFAGTETVRTSWTRSDEPLNVIACRWYGARARLRTYGGEWDGISNWEGSADVVRVPREGDPYKIDSGYLKIEIL